MSLTAPLSPISPPSAPDIALEPQPQPPSLLRHLEVDQVVHHLVRDGQVNHPIHQVEAEESDGEDDPAILVNVRSLHSKEPLRWGTWRWRRWRCQSRSCQT